MDSGHGKAGSVKSANLSDDSGHDRTAEFFANGQELGKYAQNSHSA
jgi:hypothetical protein